MISTRINSTLVLLSTLLLGPITTLSAQTVLDSLNRKPNPSFASILGVLEQVSIIIPGKGFNSIGLDEPVSDLVQKWGKPKQNGDDNALSYQLDAKTIIQFYGNERIERIVIRGLPGSIARTSNSAVFGMTRAQTRSQFNSAPSEESETFLRYDHLGIAFGFEADILTHIEVVAPSD